MIRKLSYNKIILFLAIGLIVLILVNVILSRGSETPQTNQVDKVGFPTNENRVPKATNPSSDGAEIIKLRKDLPFVGDGCQITLLNPTAAKPQLLIEVDPTTNATSCGADQFLKAHNEYLQFVEIVEKKVQLRGNDYEKYQ